LARKTKGKVMYDYNIYKLPLDKSDEFKDHLEERKFEEILLKQESIPKDSKFDFTLMFCDKDNKKGSPWISSLSSFTQIELSKELKTYGAALICKSESSCYVISYGNAHFYLSSFCDYNFGIKVAERLIKLDSIKAQQNVSHGGKLSKTHIDYLSGSTLSYRGGEIPTFVRGLSVNEELWGTYINCATSVQFKWEEKPLEIGDKLEKLDEILKITVDDGKAIPRLIALDKNNDSEKINSLFQSLAKSIDEFDVSKSTDSMVNVPSFYMVGTKLIQNDSVKFKISCNRKTEKYDGELSIEALKSYIKEKNIDIYAEIQNIKISVEYGNDSWTPLKSITEYLEFITGENFCLRNGKWCTFNDAYINQVIRDVNRIEFINHVSDEWTFNKSDLIKYAKIKDIFKDSKKQPYETYYNNKLKDILEAKIIHPTTMPLDDTENKRYRYEVCDLIKNDEMYFVKIGSPSNFAYAIDQAMLTLSKIANGYGKVKLPDGTYSKPTKFHLVLVFENRVNLISQWKDIYSMNFLIHLSELKFNLNSTDISLIVDFAYEF
jgi:uncharacterized protein (TIGR04141 family)